MLHSANLTTHPAITRNQWFSVRENLLHNTCIARGYVQKVRPALHVATLGLLHVQLESGVRGVFFAVKPICADTTATANPTPFSYQSPITEEARHDLHAIEAELVGPRFNLCQIRVPYPHIRDAMSCSSLPKASA
ncbi:hypothetical protein SAMN06295998_13322 [Primorskyibacter flagellatus]|uniref:Uncharacterized protein n=1 Tax=Primorskyibacter flagellatus TaxID=1387277 RepID=A0A1W2EMQ2_9RHOB|nr:hypothetical protein SAMN06295998_13322 [Primorskyibacter flagellatus]